MIEDMFKIIIIFVHKLLLLMWMLRILIKTVEVEDNKFDIRNRFKMFTIIITKNHYLIESKYKKA